MSERSADRVALELEAGARLVLQRVPRALSASEFAEQLGDSIERPVRVVDGAAPAEPDVVRVLDARGWLGPESFQDWDARRGALATPAAPLVVLLDVATGAALLRNAPQLASWAGGVRLPVERSVRPAEKDEELRLGREAQRRAFDANPGFRPAHLGQVIAVDLLTERLFAPRPDAGALSVAREYLDEGIVYLERIRE